MNMMMKFIIYVIFLFWLIYHVLVWGKDIEDKPDKKVNAI